MMMAKNDAFNKNTPIIESYLDFPKKKAEMKSGDAG
jgi:hypothetical protein